MHFLGCLSPAVHEGLRFNGLTRSETKDTLNIVSRARILAGAAAWHAHGKSHPQDKDTEEVETADKQPWRKHQTSALPSAPALPTTGTPNVMLGEDFAPVAAPYVNPTDATRQAYEYHWRKPDARTQAGRNVSLQGISHTSARADRNALTKDMHTARHRTARIALPPHAASSCSCGEPGYSRDGNTMCAPCRLASHHFGSHDHQSHARRHMCAHCQVCGSDEPEYTTAGLTWACRACAEHIAGTMAPRPRYSFALPKACADCGSAAAPRYGLDGRPLCTTCQDPSYTSYLFARAGIIVQDYLNVCHDMHRTVPVNARTKPALLALAQLLPLDPINGQLFQPTRWSVIAAAVHTLAKLVALDIDLPQPNRKCVGAQHRLLYTYQTPRFVHRARDYGTLANHTLLETRPPDACKGTKRKARQTGYMALHNDSLAATARRNLDADTTAQPRSRRNPSRRRALSDSDEGESLSTSTGRPTMALATTPAGARAPAQSLVTPSPPAGHTARRQLPAWPLFAETAAAAAASEAAAATGTAGAAAPEAAASPGDAGAAD